MRLTPDKHLHTREHLLADDLSRMMQEQARFARYLGIARMYDETELRSLAKRVIQKSDLDPKSRGKYFFGALRSLPKRADWVDVVRARKSSALKKDPSRKRKVVSHERAAHRQTA